MKKIIIGFIFLLIASGGFLAGKYFKGQGLHLFSRQKYEFVIPESAPDIRGIVKDIRGNEIVVSQFDLAESPLKDMTKKEIREYMHDLTQEERQKIRQQMQSVLLENVSVIVPLGVPIVQRVWVGDRERIPFSDIKINGHISIWYEEVMNDSQNRARIILFNDSPLKNNQ